MEEIEREEEEVSKRKETKMVERGLRRKENGALEEKNLGKREAE